MRHLFSPHGQLFGILAACVGLMLVGCGSGLSSDAGTSSAAGLARAVSGRVMGGQQPVAGASIQIYTVNTAALRGPSQPLLTSPAVSDGNGNFIITTPYRCPSAGYGYIVATGGNAGGGDNAAIALMAGLGPCSGINASTVVNINELTTAASVYALAPFMADVTHIGYAGAATTGIANTFAMINSLVSVSQGSTPGPAAPINAAIPSTQLNTVANLLATCVNGSPANCNTLFGLTKSSAGVTPVNTIDSMVNLAGMPTANVTALFNQIPPQSPFQPTLSAAPADWSLEVKLSGGGLNSPYGLAIDAAGNAWVTNEGGFSVTKFNPQGSPLSGVTGFGSSALVGPKGLTIDLNGNVWVANTGANNVQQILPSGRLVSAAGYIAGTAPVDVAADARGMIWVANFGSGSVTELNSSGQPQNQFNANGTILRPVAIAVDPAGDLWISNSGAGTLTEYSKNGTLLSPGSGWTDGALQSPAGVALDSASTAWVAGTGGPELSGFSSTGAAAGNAPIYTLQGGRALSQPTGVAIDASRTIWVTTGSTAGSLLAFAPDTGVNLLPPLGSLNAPSGIAVDPSGNLWTANSGDNSVSIFVGIAAPTITPLVARTN